MPVAGDSLAEFNLEKFAVVVGILGTTVGAIGTIIGVFQTAHQTRIFNEQNRIMAGGTKMLPSAKAPVFKFYLPALACLLLTGVAWGVTLYRDNRRDSIFVLAAILLAAIVITIIAWPALGSMHKVDNFSPVPNVKLPFTDPRELIDDVEAIGTNIKREGGIYELRERGRIRTRTSFKLPVAFRLIAKTNSTNIRFSFCTEEIILNWEGDEEKFHVVWNLSKAPGSVVDRHGYGRIPVDTWVVIDVIVTPQFYRVLVDGSERWSAPFAGSRMNDTFSVFQGYGSVVHVRSLLVGKPD